MDIRKIIKEEISGFDFLSMEKDSSETVRDTILSSKEFQTNLVIDIINNSKDKDKFKNLSATFVNKDVDRFNDVENIELELDITYSFNEKNYDLIMFLDGEKDGDEIRYDEFEFKLFSKAGDQIKFGWIENNKKLFNALIKKIVSPFID